MNPQSTPQGQRGATLIVGLIMLTLITVMVITSFQLSMGNMQTVGNIQFRDQALAAANYALEQKVAGNLNVKITAAETVAVDLDNDNKTDLSVTVEVPTCISATEESVAAASSARFGSTLSGEGEWNVLLDFDIKANDNVTGASMRIRSGVRVLMTKTEKEAWCA